MSRATSDGQLRFLLSCVKYSNNGRVDFVEVARECGVVSKGAAAKRYERLLKANGISLRTPDAASVAATSVATAPKPVKHKTRENSAKSPAKKRKLERDGSPTTGGDARKSRITSNALSRPPGAIAIQPEAVNGVSQHSIIGGMPLGPGVPPVFIPRHPHMAHGFPPYPMQQRPGFPGFPPNGHRVDVPMYPSFAPTKFREPWNAPMAGECNGFEEYVSQDYIHQQQQFGQPLVALGPLPLRIPPPPQEVVPMEESEGGRPVEEETSKAGEGVVLLE